MLSSAYFSITRTLWQGMAAERTTKRYVKSTGNNNYQHACKYYKYLMQHVYCVCTKVKIQTLNQHSVAFTANFIVCIFIILLFHWGERWMLNALVFILLEILHAIPFQMIHSTKTSAVHIFSIGSLIHVIVPELNWIFDFKEGKL